MGAYVLVATGHAAEGGAIEARQVFEKLLLLLLTEGFWPHGTQGFEARLLQPDDVVLFCLAAESGPKIVGEGVVAQASTPVTSQALAELRVYLGPAMPPDPSAFTHVVALTQLEVWDQPWVPRPDSEAAAFELSRALTGADQLGAVRPIRTETFEQVVGRPVPRETGKLAESPEVTDPSPPTAACSLQDFLAANWSLVDFGEPLCQLNGTGEGGRTVTPAGPIDVLCEAEASGDLVALMWADRGPPGQLMDALVERLAWLRQNLARQGQRVRGMIISLDSHAPLDAPDSEDIEVRRVRITCEPVAPQPTLAASRADVLEGPDVEPPRLGAGRRANLDFAAKCLRVPLSRRDSAE